MYCRLLTAILLCVYSVLGITNENIWNCALNNKASQQKWTCADAQQTPTKTPAITKTLPPSQPLQNTKIPASSPVIAVSAQAKTKTSTNTSSVFTVAFNDKQEQVFEDLYSQLKYDPWASCLIPTKNQPKHRSKKYLRSTADIDITANYSEVFAKEMTYFSGNVEMLRADQKVITDNASYDIISETMGVEGHVYYSEHELSSYSESALLNLDTDEARLRKTLFILPASPIRGSADVVYRDSKSLSRYTNTAFTSCRPNNQDWVVHAQRLKINKLTGKASAKHAWLEFKGIPVLYTPYISFALDDRRLSGFLPPSLSYNKDNGYDFTAPYYWNIAPNYDLTVWPRYMNKRGGLLGTKFRYLTHTNQGEIGLEYMLYDELYNDKSRYSGHFTDEAQYTPNLKTSIDLRYVSDEEYFTDLDGALGITSSRFLNNSASLEYQYKAVDFRLNVETHQTIDRTIADGSKPYKKLPQITLNFNHAITLAGQPIHLNMQNEYVHFYRDGRITGQRLNLKPYITLPIQTLGAFVKPKVAVQYSHYFLTDQPSNQADSIIRALPIVSVDSGLFLERHFNMADRRFLHSIEPRLFYLYIPRHNQNDIPIFDTSLNDFNFNSLFRENRFSGADRIQDANQLTMAVTTRLIDSKSGQERLNLSIGEIFYFQDRSVTLNPNTDTKRRDFSNLVFKMSGQLNDYLSFSSGIQLNPKARDISRGQAALQYRNPLNHIINLGYRYRRDNPNAKADIIQTDASVRWPIYDNWFGVGRWLYSLKDNISPESFLGLEKESCCWRFRVIWRRHANNSSANDDIDQGIFVQLELKGFASFGDKAGRFLQQNLKGYIQEK